MAARTLLAQYESGESEAVWQQIRSYPDLDEGLRDEVLGVAEATMRRVATNADPLANRLHSRGWRALGAEFSDLRTSPSPKDDAIWGRYPKSVAVRFPLHCSHFGRSSAASIGSGTTLMEPFRIDLAPDYLHKANISGGMPYAILVPFPGADPVLADERLELPFVEYLRLAFKWGGFPGLEEHAQRDDVQRFVAEFGIGILPF